MPSSKPEHLGQSGASIHARQDALLDVLRSAWRHHPHERLCQLMWNATGRDDPFYVEDDELAMALIEYAPEPLPTPPKPPVGATDELTPRGHR